MTPAKKPAKDVLERLDVGQFSEPDGDGTVALVITPAGPALLPASIRSLGPEAAEKVAEVQAIGLQIAELREQLDSRILELRDLGVAWSGIGFAVGLTAEGARLRWGPE